MLILLSHLVDLSKVPDICLSGAYLLHPVSKCTGLGCALNLAHATPCTASAILSPFVVGSIICILHLQELVYCELSPFLRQVSVLSSSYRFVSVLEADHSSQCGHHDGALFRGAHS